MADFSLDTSSFAESAKAASALATSLSDAISEADKAVNRMLDSWVGKGRNEFQKKYHIFEQQVTDLKHGLWDLYEAIISAEEAYILADTEAAKKE